jgi:hypothetical protein
MKGKLGVPESMRESLSSFVKSEGIMIEIAPEALEDLAADEHSAGAPGAVTVRQAPDGERPKSDLRVLHAGGWIPCEVALAMAERLSVSPQDMGKLCDHLKVKVRDCNLGCF